MTSCAGPPPPTRVSPVSPPVRPPMEDVILSELLSLQFQLSREHNQALTDFQPGPVPHRRDEINSGVSTLEKEHKTIE